MSRRLKLRNVEDAYPLSPLQQGILFHNLYALSAGEYFMQMFYTMRGNSTQRPSKARGSRSSIAILYCARHSSGQVCEPLQIVRQQATLEWAQEDVCGLSRVEQEEMLEAYLMADRRRGFELSQAPVLRYALIHSAADEHKLIWSYHHFRLDG